MAVALEKQSAYDDRRPEAGLFCVDFLRVPVVGRMLRWRGTKLTLQIALFLLAGVLVWHGLFGPDLAPKNLATLVTWVHYRGLLVLVLLVAGNFFCFACPFLLPREVARLIFRPVWNLPMRLRNKWLAVALFVFLLFGYELFGLWGEPAWTAWLIVAYFAGALVVDAVFKHASFCKWVCPIGQFNFLASAMSPLQVAVRDLNVCVDCRTKDCICGTPAPDDTPVVATEEGGKISLKVVSQRGCELALFQPMKVGNMDCTFCLDCVHACPHDNVGLISQMPGSELWGETSRSGIGRPLERKDMAALALVFTFGALLNAFGMVSPVYAVQAWLSSVLETDNRTAILAVLFVGALVVEPVALLGLASWWTRRATASKRSVLAVGTRYAHSLIPLGFGVWLAHYAFHFLTGILTIVPVTQNALMEIGWPVLGAPNWELAGMRSGSVYPLELGLLTLGMIGSWVVAVRLARNDSPLAPWRAYLPWVVLHGLLWVSAVWLLAQPMEMRGTFLGG
jgi:hypothetical protein